MPPTLPDHIEETIRSIRRLHVEHHSISTVSQRAIDGITAAIARPSFVALLAIAVSLWMAANLVGIRLGFPMPDAPPFP